MICQQRLVNHADEIARICISTFLNLPSSFHPAPRSNGTPQYCILAGIVLERPEEDICPSCNSHHVYYECVTVATGSKCLSECKLRLGGQALHDSHAEVLARRGFMRWLFEEILRIQADGYVSHWVHAKQKVPGEEQNFRMHDTIKVHLYVSILPCTTQDKCIVSNLWYADRVFPGGDASMLALSRSQNPEMAALKAHSSSSISGSSPEAALRGRNGYDLRGAWRTKPGRADAEPTLSMSCSDKIAAWSLVGLQGALLSTILEPVYIYSIVIGEIEPEDVEAMSNECARAFSTRLKEVPELPSPFRRHPPCVLFTNVSFQYSRSQVIVQSENDVIPLATSEATSWIRGSTGAEVLVGGLKRGATAKSILAQKACSLLSKVSMLDIYDRTRLAVGLPSICQESTYSNVKHQSTKYQEAKRRLRAPGGPLFGWIVSGERWESFKLSKTMASSSRIKGFSS